MCKYMNSTCTCSHLFLKKDIKYCIRFTVSTSAKQLFSECSSCSPCFHVQGRKIYSKSKAGSNLKDESEKGLSVYK